MAKMNNAKNIVHYCDRCEKAISKIQKEKDMVVFVDPARAGVDRKVIEAILKLNPRKVVYMSCNPETCVRDIKYLVCDNKYNVSVIKPYNMFPFTKHIELLVLLNRLEC